MTCVSEITSRFLASKRDAMTRGELVAKTYFGYEETVRKIDEHLGENVEDLTPDAFTNLNNRIAETNAAGTRKVHLQRVRTIFKTAYEAGWLDKEVSYGPGFKTPPRRLVIRERRMGGVKMFERDELLGLIAAAKYRGMYGEVMMGINCGLGNHDVSELRFKHIVGNWLSYPRPKTEIPRRCHIWPETLKAIREPGLRLANGRVFARPNGRAWQTQVGSSLTDYLSRKTKVVLQERGEWRQGLGFYSLRRTFATIAGETLDQAAVDYIMGHYDESMSAVYRQRIGDDRLLGVSEYVHDWLFGERN